MLLGGTRRTRVEKGAKTGHGGYIYGEARPGKKRCRERTKIATAPAKQRQLHRPRDVWTKIFLTELSLQTSIFKSHDSSFSAFFFFFVYFFWLLSHSLFKQHAQLGNARCSQTRYHCDHCDHCNPSPVHRAGHWSEAIEWEDEKREKVMLPEMERHCGLK